MHRSKIEWTDDVWNPITGCMNNCQYCYSKKASGRFSGDIKKNMATLDYGVDGDLFILKAPFISETGNVLNYPFGFRPTYHKYRLDYPERRKNGCNILVGESGEMFGDWVPDKYINEIMRSCERHPEHNYLFLTQNPSRYWELEDKGIIPAGDNMWYGFTYMSNSSEGWASKYNDKHNFVCVSPLHEDLILFDEDCYPAGEWVIIGAETESDPEKVVPEKAWIDKIVRHCDKYKIPIYMMDSIELIVGVENMRREYPDALLNKEISLKVQQRLDDVCCHCKESMRKNKMIALSARTRRGEMPKQFAFMCHSCFRTFCAEKGVEVPELNEMQVDK